MINKNLNGYKITVNRALITVSVGLILITVIIIGLTSYFFANRALINHAHNIMDNMAASTVIRSENYLLPAHNTADIARRLLKDNVLDYSNLRMMENYFFEQLQTYKQFAGIFFGAPDGSFFYVNRDNIKTVGGYRVKNIKFSETGVRQITLKWIDKFGNLIANEIDDNDKYDPRQRPWYKQAVSEMRLTWTEPYIFFTSRKPGITTASPVIDKKGNIKGVVGVDIEIAQISKFLSNLDIGKTGKAFVMDKMGKMIAFPEIDKIYKNNNDTGKFSFNMINEIDDPISSAAYEFIKSRLIELSPSIDLFNHFELDGKKYLSTFKQFTGANKPWIIGIWVPEDDYLGELNDGFAIIAITTIIITIFAIMLAFAFSRSFNNSIKWLSDSAKNMGNKTFDISRKQNSIFYELDEAIFNFKNMHKKLTLTDDKNKELQEKLIQSTSMKSAFIANVSHELRTPMNAIIGFSSLLEGQRFGNLSYEQKDFLNEINTAGIHLNDMINNLIEISEIEGGEVALEYEAVDLNFIIDDILMVFDSAIMRKQINIKLDIINLPIINSDKRICRQIILNIFDNALRFTPNAGDIKLFSKISNNKIIISICNTGDCIDGDRIDDIFEPFVQLLTPKDKNNKGTGISLTIARALSHLLNSDIKVNKDYKDGVQIDFHITYDDE